MGVEASLGPRGGVEQLGRWWRRADGRLHCSGGNGGRWCSVHTRGGLGCHFVGAGVTKGRAGVVSKEGREN
jgi:hypothetical protein